MFSFDQYQNKELVWFPESGRGYYPCDPADAPYDVDYFQKYESYEGTEIGDALNDFRVSFANAAIGDAELVDVGIGSGTFVKSRAKTYGFDINPAGIEWLRTRKLFRDPYYGCDYASFWDSLEHIKSPALILSQIKRGVIVSIPIFSSAEHAVSSKHFRKDEHYWYFTREGFIEYMHQNNFTIRAHSCMESILGREDIESFYFERTGN